jgi:Rrf2 family protein
MQQLCRSGIATSQRGLHGGYSLSRHALDLSVYDVVAAVDGPPPRSECPLDRGAEPSQQCPLCKRLIAVDAAAQEQLRTISIAELLDADASPA